jgi:hypothetical protein
MPATSQIGRDSPNVYARANDGGFVRTAAGGWSDGAARHFLPDEDITRLLDAGTSIVARTHLRTAFTSARRGGHRRSAGCANDAIFRRAHVLVLVVLGVSRAKAASAASGARWA